MGPGARQVIGWIARQMAAAGEDDSETTGLEFAQRISVALHKAIACARALS